MVVILGWLALVMLVIIVRISSGFLWPEDIGLVVDWLEGWLVGPKRCNLSKSLDRAVASRCIVDTGQ